MLPANSYLLGAENEEKAIYVIVNEHNFLPGTRKGNKRYVRGDGVQPALDAGKITTLAEAARQIQVRQKKRFAVHLPDGRIFKFGIEKTAQRYADQSGGTLEVLS